MSKAENNIYRVKTDGFHGKLFIPAEDMYPGKVLICFTGIPVVRCKMVKLSIYQ